MNPKDFAMNRRNLSAYYLKQYCPSYSISNPPPQISNFDKLRDRAKGNILLTAATKLQVMLRQAS